MKNSKNVYSLLLGTIPLGPPKNLKSLVPVLMSLLFSMNARAMSNCDEAGNKLWQAKVAWGSAAGQMFDARDHGASPKVIAKLADKCNQLNRPVQGYVDMIWQTCTRTDDCRAANTDLANAAEEMGIADGRFDASSLRGASDDERYNLLMKSNSLGVGMQKYFDEFSKNCVLAK